MTSSLEYLKSVLDSALVTITRSLPEKNAAEEGSFHDIKRIKEDDELV